MSFPIIKGSVDDGEFTTHEPVPLFPTQWDASVCSLFELKWVLEALLSGSIFKLRELKLRNKNDFSQGIKLANEM